MLQDKLGGTYAKSVYLLVVVTEALYSSIPCLKELHAAKTRGVTVIPVRFEDCSVSNDAMWPGVKTGSQEERWQGAVSAWFDELNSEPAPPATVYSLEQTLPTLIRDTVVKGVQSKISHKDSVISVASYEMSFDMVSDQARTPPHSPSLVTSVASRGEVRVIICASTARAFDSWTRTPRGTPLCTLNNASTPVRPTAER